MLNRGKNENGHGHSISVFSKSKKKLLETESSSRLAKPGVEDIDVHGVPLAIDRGLLATRSSKVDNILKQNRNEDLSYALRDMPGDWQLFEQVLRFCHGYDPVLTSVNAIPLFCLAHFLGMTEAHSQGNLLPKVSAFIRDKILPSWNESVKAVRSSEAVLQIAAELGLIDACMESIVTRAVSDPNLLGPPMAMQDHDDDIVKEDDEEEEEVEIRYAQPAVRRRLFDQEWNLEDLTRLPLQLYEPIMLGMIHNKVPASYIASNLTEYVNKWVFPYVSSSQIAQRIHAKAVIEAVERMLPEERGLIPCTVLFQMLRFASLLEAGSICRNGLELRIGKQLDLAKVSDLLIPSQGYTKEFQYDVDCVKRIMKIFYSSFADEAPVLSRPASGQSLTRVAALMEDFLAEVASDIDLKLDTFCSLAELSAAASSGSHRSSDGIYRAIDVFLNKHRYLTEAERDKACQVLDCQSMSSEAMEHAAQNERLPLRIVVQAVFADQLKLRSAIAKEVVTGPVAENEEVVKMESKVLELERECVMIRKEIEKSEIGKGKKEKRGGGGVWKEMKRKFGCMSSESSVGVHDCNCQVIKKKKVHPRRNSWNRWGFQIIGDPNFKGVDFPTSLCMFQWVRRHLPDGTRQYIEGATNPEYVDDVDRLIAAECIPMDDYNRQGEIVRLFANDQKKITCEPDMQHEIDTYLAKGQATFVVDLLMEDSPDNWEPPATLTLRKSSFQIKINNGGHEIISEV